MTDQTKIKGTLDSQERIDNIMRVDATALLKTIRDIEYKLSEHQRQDKMPSWAVTLEARIDAMEKRSWSNEAIADEKNRAANSESQTSLPEELMNDNSASHKTISFAAEDRIISKLRHETNLKIETSQLTMESKMTSFSLEVERLHKLLNIRPTTSELQQLTNYINTIQQKMQAGMDDVNNSLAAMLENKLSDEINAIVEQIVANRLLNEKGIGLIQKKVEDYELEMSDLKVRLEESNQNLEGRIDTLNEKSSGGLSEIEVTKDKLQSQDEALNELRNMTSKLALAIEKESKERIKMEELISEKNELNHNKVLEMIEKDDDKMKNMEKAIRDLENVSSSMKEDMDSRMMKLDVANANVIQNISLMQAKNKEMQRVVTELVGMDFDGKFAKHDEQVNKCNYDIIDLKNSISNILKVDFVVVHEIITSIQEELKKIPVELDARSLKIQKLFDLNAGAVDEIEKLQEKLHATDVRVKSLLPLTDEIEAVRENLRATDFEVSGVKEIIAQLTNTSENTIRRLVDLEENVDQIEDNISSRLNTIRDVIMEAVVEKQNEIDIQLRQMRENLEIISKAGEMAALVKGGGGGGGMGQSFNVANGGGSPNKSRSSFAAKGNLSINDNSDGDNTIGSLSAMGASSRNFSGQAPTNPHDILSRQVSYVKPSINGAVITGGTPPIMNQRPNRSSSVGNFHNNNGNNDNQAASIQNRRPSIASNTRPLSPSPELISPPNGIAEQSPSYKDMNGTTASVTSNLSRPSTADSKNKINMTLNNAPTSTTGTAVGIEISDSMSIASARGSDHEDNNNLLSPHSLHSLVSNEQMNNNYNGNGNPYNEYAAVSGFDDRNFPLGKHSQFIADLCIRKRAIDIPPVMCDHISTTLQEASEQIAKSSDAEMIQYMLEVNSSTTPNITLSEAKYDETFVVNRRQQKQNDFVHYITDMVVSHFPQPGIVRLEARTLFLALIHKALDMFMSKHNQILVVGNSRLGRQKIPSCIACDRPLLDKQKSDESMRNYVINLSKPSPPIIYEISDDDDDDTKATRRHRKKKSDQLNDFDLHVKVEVRLESAVSNNNDNMIENDNNNMDRSKRLSRNNNNKSSGIKLPATIHRPNTAEQSADDNSFVNNNDNIRLSTPFVTETMNNYDEMDDNMFDDNNSKLIDWQNYTINTITHEKLGPKKTLPVLIPSSKTSINIKHSL
eukprot:gene7327-9985_t